MKAHLTFSESRISTGAKCMPLCGTKESDEISDVRIVATWDDIPVGVAPVWPAGLCRACLKEVDSIPQSGRYYLYAITRERNERD